MWIRSQNKELLIDAKRISIELYHTGISRIKENGIVIAEYYEKEKAMSVLDDLQCRIARSEIGVYQMPEDE